MWSCMHECKCMCCSDNLFIIIFFSCFFLVLFLFLFLYFVFVFFCFLFFRESTCNPQSMKFLPGASYEVS